MAGGIYSAMKEQVIGLEDRGCDIFWPRLRSYQNLMSSLKNLASLFVEIVGQLFVNLFTQKIDLQLPVLLQ